MSSRICGQVLDSSLSGNIRWVALAIADHADTDGECVMKLANVTRATRLSETTCRAMMRRMEDAGMLTIERAGGGRISLMKIHPEKFDPTSSEGSSSEGSNSEGSKSEGSSSEGSKEVVRFGKSQEESGLQEFDGLETGANGQESGASAPSLPSPSSPLTLPLLSPNLSSPDIPERVEGEDARRGNQFGVAQVTMFDEKAEIDGRKKAKKAEKAHPTEAEVVAYMAELGMPENDGVYLHANWEAGGWTRNGKPIKDWKACARTWKAGGFLPSQKASTGRGGVVRGYRKIDYSKGF